VLILGHEDVVRALPPDQCANAMAEVLAGHARGESFLPLRSIAAPPDAGGFIGLMPGWRGPHTGVPATFGLKAICLIPDNPSRGLDAHQGTVTLFDGETGVPAAILDASAVTEIRTAAVTAVATRTLARAQARVLAIIGAGVQGRAHIEALLGVRDFDEIRVCSRTEAHAQAVADLDPRASVSSCAEDAVRGADVVVTATNSREPVIQRSWLAAGAHVNAVGASAPSSREIDTATVAAAALFCDSRESVLNEAGEFRLAIADGLITGEDHIRAELGEVLEGIRPGRIDDDELTLFRSLGVAIEDIAAAQVAVANARAHGLGTEVSF
jgi:ornithine cyclodeaminase/alanine dehydrogenase-like protein (mu-crystallin family)